MLYVTILFLDQVLHSNVRPVISPNNTMWSIGIYSNRISNYGLLPHDFHNSNFFVFKNFFNTDCVLCLAVRLLCFACMKVQLNLNDLYLTNMTVYQYGKMFYIFL